ncbi:MAG: hypothetical protein K2M87_04655 [Muribaculaceae bacterium]|nr:hypothetical protein [Muribaculaceae bacterium]
MRKTHLLILMALMLCLPAVRAQVVTTEPSPLQEDSENVVIYFHSDRGNRGLLGAPATEPIYAYTGVNVADAAGNISEWQYAPAWDSNDEKYRMQYVSEDLWKLEIGDLYDFYGVPADKTIKQLCFRFRNGNGTQTALEEGGSDIFVDVLDAGFQLAFRQSRASTIIGASTNKIKFTATTTQPAEIKILIDDSLVEMAQDATQLQTTYTFEKEGDYRVVAVATKGKKVLSQQILMVYARDSKKSNLTTVPPMGVTKNADKTYTFCLAAPEKYGVMLLGSWNDYAPTNDLVMDYIDGTMDGATFRYFTITLPESVTGTEFGYHYVVDGTTAVGDPYARLVLDPQNDKYISEEVYPNMPAYPAELVRNNPVIAWYSDNLLDYEWKSGEFVGAAKDDLVVYELLLRDFTGTEGMAKGNGTVRQAIEKLPYLKQLGVNVIELLPINEFNGNNSWGYNPNFYFAADKAYGTPQDYKELIDKCHEAGIAVVLDIVFNQCDWQHPWYKMYKTGENPFVNASAPHAFSVLNDWNQGYPLVKKQWDDCVQFWLSEYRVDGFRFDLVKGLGDNDSYANSSSSATGAYNASRVANMKRIHDAMRKVNPNAYFINENLAGSKEENEMAADGELNWANVNDAGCQFAMGYSSNSNTSRVWALRDGRTVGSTVAYLESHDEYRLGYKQIQWGVAGVKDNEHTRMQRLGGAAAQLILAPGSHMIWMFGELGDSQNSKSSDGNNLTGPKKVDWNALSNPDRYALYKSYCGLIGIRLQHKELFAENSNYTMNFAGWASGRTASATSGDKELYLAVNPNVDKPITVKANFLKDDNSTYHIALQSHDCDATFDAAAKTITVPANCFAVVTTKQISGVEDIENEGTESAFAYAVDGGIRVVGYTGVATVFTLDGRIAGCVDGIDGSITVEPGIYLVKMGAKAAKLMVK